MKRRMVVAGGLATVGLGSDVTWTMAGMGTSAEHVDATNTLQSLLAGDADIKGVV